MKAKLLTILFLITLIPTAAYAAENSHEMVQAWIEQNVPALMREARMPGFAIAVVQNGETIYAGGFGARDPAKGLPATPDTFFGIGSIT